MISRMLILSATLLLGGGYLSSTDRLEATAIRASFDRFPMQIGEWRGQRAADFDSKILTILGVTEYLNRVYTREDRTPTGLYIGYYQSQRQGSTMHSPMNCLPGAGWQPVSSGALNLTVQDSSSPREITVNRYVIQKGESKQVVLYWYQSQGRVIASEYWSKIYMVLDAIKTNRTDAALIRVIVPTSDLSDEAESAAERRAVEFVQEMFPRLGTHLPS